MRVALLQMQARLCDVPANLALIGDAAQRAALAGADLLITPELATTGYGAGEDFAQLAEPADGAQARSLAGISARTGVSLVVGFAERAEGAVFNSALLLKRGALAGTYRKRQLYGAYERSHFTPGDCRSQLFEIGGLKAGLAICYDIEFPETARELALAGAELILVPTALPRTPLAPFIAERLLPVRAFENQVFIAYADHAGSDAAFTYAGLSCIVAPDGSDLARAGGEGPELLVADLDVHAYSACRAENPYLRDLRSFDATSRS